MIKKKVIPLESLNIGSVALNLFENAVKLGEQGHPNSIILFEGSIEILEAELRDGQSIELRKELLQKLQRSYYKLIVEYNLPENHRRISPPPEAGLGYVPNLLLEYTTRTREISGELAALNAEN